MSWARHATRVAATVARVLGNAVVMNNVPGGGILLMPKEEVLNGMVVSTGYQLEVPAETFGAVLEDQVLTVDGVAYIATEDAMPAGDGAMLLVPLKKLEGDSVTVIYDGDWA